MVQEKIRNEKHSIRCLRNAITRERAKWQELRRLKNKRNMLEQKLKLIMTDLSPRSSWDETDDRLE